MKSLSYIKISNSIWILSSLMLSGLLGRASMCLAEEGTWITRSPMPTARSHLSASLVDGIIYTIGGTQSVYQEYFSTVEAYDTATDTWTKKADMPTGRARLSTCVVDGKIYAIGGSPHQSADLSTVEVYDPVMDTWTRKTDMPTKRCWLSTSVVNGKIYAIGGKIYPSGTMVSTVEEYDPATDTWTSKADMPTARMGLSTSVVNGKIYAIGGVVTEGGLGPGLSTVEVYDPATNTWTRKTDMPTARNGPSAGVVSGRIYLIGGSTGGAIVFSTVEVYDPVTDTWTKGPDMPTARGAWASAGVADGKIYVIGGYLSPSTWEPTATVEVYEPAVPPPDFNGDFKIDIEDLIILIEHWGQDDPMCDIAPWPFGDGIVDVLDLELLMSYWGQEVYDPTLIAHWALDETEGDIAYDSVADCNGTLIGGPVWQPTGGAVDGALAFDGIDDYVSTPFVLSPADGSFSVFAWIKGGAPGQVVISQADDVNWLSADPSEGNLITELMGPGRGTAALMSNFVIIDGAWHRIGFVWDGSQRILYVDDVEVATDMQDSLKGSAGGLYIGAGNALEAGSFFSGLIDDVRIYNRAVTP